MFLITTMKKFEITRVEELAVGDIFYKQNDKSKMLYEKISDKTVKKRSDKYPQSMNGNTLVIFLRNSNTVK